MTSRLGYCNSLLYCIYGYSVSQLQRCQNNAARKYDHITPVLKELHWMPVEQRIDYKILLLTYEAPHGLAPLYMSSLLSPYKPRRPLRSEDNILRLLDIAWIVLASVALPMPPLTSGTLYPYPSSVRSPSTSSRNARRHIFLSLSSSSSSSSSSSYGNPTNPYIHNDELYAQQMMMIIDDDDDDW